MDKIKKFRAGIVKFWAVWLIALAAFIFILAVKVWSMCAHTSVVLMLTKTDQTKDLLQKIAVLVTLSLQLVGVT